MPFDSSLLDRIVGPGSLAVVFQPIFAVGGPRPTLFGLECLVRGPRDTNAEDPTVLFDYVRRKRAEGSVDRVCVAAALEEAGRLPAAPRLSLNVHASTLGQDPRFSVFILGQAEESGIDPSRLLVEIVEHAPPLNGPCFRRALDELRAAEVAIALDDVGLGRSNYKMILDVRPDVYKLDRYLVAGASNDGFRRVVLDSLAGLARRLGGRVVAEGIETPDDLDAVRSAGIELAQGFLLARPVPGQELVASGFLSSRKPAPPSVPFSAPVWGSARDGAEAQGVRTGVPHRDRRVSTLEHGRHREDGDRGGGRRTDRADGTSTGPLGDGVGGTLDACSRNENGGASRWKMTASRPRVLIADDEEAALLALGEYLICCGCDVSLARRPSEARDLIEKGDFSVVITDLRFWGPSGTEGLAIARAARAHRPTGRVLILTAYSTPEVEEQARDIGVEALLHKPIPLWELARVVMGQAPPN